MGDERLNALIQESLAVAAKTKALKPSELTAVEVDSIRCGGTTFNFRFFRARLAAEAGTEDERLCKVTGISTGSYGRTATGGSK